MPRTGMICWDCNIFASAFADDAKLVGCFTANALNSVVDRFITPADLFTDLAVRETMQIKREYALLK